MDQSPSPKDLWEARYGGDGRIFGVEPNDFLRESLPLLGSGRALCLAEGEGRNAVFLAQSGFEVTAVDLAESGVRKTLELAAQRGVHVDAHAADLADYELGESAWELVVSIFAHMPPAVRADLHRRVAQSLKPGGIFLLEAYTPAQIGRGTGGPPAAELTMTLADLRRELEPLEFLHAVELEREVIEGSGHRGLGAVVQLIARRPA